MRCLCIFQRSMSFIKAFMSKLQKQWGIRGNSRPETHIAPVEGKGEVVPMFAGWPRATIKSKKKQIGIPND